MNIQHPVNHLRTIFKMLNLPLFCALLMSCGENNTRDSSLAECSTVQSFQGNKRINIQDVGTLKNQVPIDLNQKFSALEIAVFEKTFESIVKDTHITDWTITVAIPGKGSWTKTHIAATANIEPSKAVFWWMSVGKSFTATLILQLIDEGKLTLDTNISHFFPNMKNSHLITIDHLLTHTSGLYSFQEDPIFRATQGYLDPNQLLNIALSHEPNFCPGAQWYYSNTGYVVLGLIIEKIEQKKYHHIIQERISTPLHLTKTFALQAKEFPSNLLLNSNGVFPSTPFSAGNIVSNSEGMVKYLQSVLTSQLYSAPLLNTATTQYYAMFEPSLYYGKGIISFYSTEHTMNWIGHSGGAESANALIAYDFESGAYLALSVNDKTPASAIAFRFFKAANSFLHKQK